MNPSGAGRPRGFRALSAEELVRNASIESGEAPPNPNPTQPPGQLSRSSGWRWALAAAGVLVVAIVIIAALAFKLGSGAAISAASSSPSATPAAAKSATPLPVTDVYRQVVPSVVLITTSKGSLGSGVIVTDTGTVVTAHHVVAGGGTIRVLFSDGTKATAKVGAANPANDIALLIPTKLPEVVVPATLGGAVTVGSDVVAIGNPLGLRDSTTTGIVSGLNRSTKIKTGSLSGLIQFDAAVNPGSSGGPLLDSKGLVVGVVVSIADPGQDDAFAGIGFAVPIGAALAGGSDDGQSGGPQR